MGLISGLMRAAYFFSMKPHITIQQYGQRTPNPRISVSVGAGNARRQGWFSKQLFKTHTPSGVSQGVYCRDDTDAGLAELTMYANGLAHAFGAPIINKHDGVYYRTVYDNNLLVPITVAPGQYVNVGDVVYRNKSNQACVIAQTKGASIPPEFVRVTEDPPVVPDHRVYYEVMRQEAGKFVEIKLEDEATKFDTALYTSAVKLAECLAKDTRAQCFVMSRTKVNGELVTKYDKIMHYT